MDGKVERAHIIFSHDDWGQPGGAGHRVQGAAASPSCHPAGAAHDYMYMIQSNTSYKSNEQHCNHKEPYTCKYE